MNQLKALIIDDEILNIKNLEFYISSYFPNLSVEASFTEVQAAADFIHKNAIDLVFLDIQMPTASGFDLLDLFPERAFDIIFVTAFEEFALKAIKAGAVDYVLKPIILSDLTNAVERVLTKRSSLLVNKPSETNKNNKFLLQNSESKWYVSKDEILYIQGIDNICKVFFANNTKIILSKTLKHFESLFGEDFYRIHKSFLVNLSCCNSILTSEKFQVVLKNNTKLPVSRRSVKMLKDRLIQL